MPNEENEENIECEDEDGDESESDWTDPYFFRPLYSAYREIIKLVGTWPKDEIHASHFARFTEDHDVLRKLCAWNFLAPMLDEELPEYQPAIFLGDWLISYRITQQSREFAKLELSNISDLSRAILILLRADMYPETRMGIFHSGVRTIGFYELVMLLNRTEQSVFATLQRLKALRLIDLNLILTEDGRVFKWGSRITIREEGIQFIDKGGHTMSFNNINIVNSSVGIAALESTLSNIDANVGNIKNSGNADFAHAISQVTEEVTQSNLSEAQKREILEQVEVLTEQAQKQPNERKPAIVKAVMSFLDKALSSAAMVVTVWKTHGPLIRSFFGI